MIQKACIVINHIDLPWVLNLINLASGARFSPLLELKSGVFFDSRHDKQAEDSASIFNRSLSMPEAILHTGYAAGKWELPRAWE